MSSRTVRRSVPVLTLALAAGLGIPMLHSAANGDETTTAPATERALVPADGVVAYSLVAPTNVSPSGIVARAIVAAGADCPSVDVTVGSKQSSVAMTIRRPGATTGNAFSAVRVCSASLPKGATSASIQGTAIPAAMPTDAASIAYLSDTGCRIKLSVQDCASSQAWPLSTNAALLSQQSADLIVHGGDYVYRETDCPAADEAKCGGSPPITTGEPFLDNAALWFADFFDPAAPMLSAAPILASRGNHEACDMAGNGYFLFMDIQPSSAAACAPKRSQAPIVLSPTWAADVDLAGNRSVRLVVVDSTNGWDSVPSPYVPIQRKAYKKANKLAKKASDAWLVTHRPLFGVTSSAYSDRGDHYWVPWISADQAAAGSGLLSRYSLIISGHEHLSQAVQVPGQPTQLVAGGGGTSLNPTQGYSLPQYGPLTHADGSAMSDTYKPYKPATYLWNEVDFAIVLATPGATKGSWSMGFTKPNGNALGTCAVTSGAVSCQ